MKDGTLTNQSTDAELPEASYPEGSRTCAALTIVFHPIAHRAGEQCLLRALSAGQEVAVSRNAPDFTRPGGILGLALSDPFLSRKPIRFAPGDVGRVRLLVDDHAPVLIVGGERIHRHLEIGPDELAAGVPLQLGNRIVLLLHLTDIPQERTPESLDMVGDGAKICRVRKEIEQVADLNVPVLIRGETGTGKELVARAIHRLSARRDARFVSVNLGAIPRELAAAELFGAVRGAFTGAARDRDGFFRAAHGGTLFLDEVGEASPEVQALLLRVLETGEMYPVGASSPIATNVRLIAATDARLEEQIREGRFKAPLLHRLAGYEIRMPPLRERREDIGLLFHHFVREELEALGQASRLETSDPHTEPWLPASFVASLVRSPWPGNIRQLRNMSRQIVIASRAQPRLRVDPRLEQEFRSAPEAPPARPAPAPITEVRSRSSEISEQALLDALRESSWDIKPTAERLGIPRSSLYDLIEKSPNVRTAKDLDPEEIARCFQASGGDLDSMVRQLSVSKQALRRRIKELGLDAKVNPTRAAGRGTPPHRH